ncbi:aspartyl/glutamyl-tRNA(Asn/Gln) amidotransferase subunit C [Alicyclobacillus contaminans]|uniref:Asp-tRNA(Asn)/Glu-tRNA(Gln) amidotransferase subunit GatC n=1 Tax=Alicyclobacillus contaminans TaxID=392016 RepID=UPI000428B573|nr:Asp-tRNA(Asn)/Glu-tRNA(Gln) amidotransferase subunit GatC [Alicyclobacillus contaminans]GMA50022.1 aspartyl/glutamyl-tRNA(Asn/Gln) amidotransferase subunit C [Alicyclobacillus contaminans]
MKITEDTIRHVAKLARLAVSDEDVAKLAPQLNDIMGYNEQLQALPLDEVPPTSHPFALYNALRDDEPRPGLTREQALANAPDSDGEQVRVPAVLEG